MGGLGGGLQFGVRTEGTEQASTNKNHLNKQPQEERQEVPGGRVVKEESRAGLIALRWEWISMPWER